MKGLVFQANSEGIEETYLENEKSSHIIVVCDVCSPFSDHLKESILASAKQLAKDSLSEYETISEGEIRKTFHKVNEHLRNEHKKDKKRVALSMAVITYSHAQQSLLIATSGDIHICKSTESGLSRLLPEKEINTYISERERLKELHQAMIRNPAPFVKISNTTLSQNEHIAVVPQSVFEEFDAHELNHAIAEPHNPDNGFESLLGRSAEKLGSTELTVVLSTEESLEASAQPIEPVSIPSEIPSTPHVAPETFTENRGKKRGSQKTLALGIAVCAVMAAAGFTLYELSSKSPRTEAQTVKVSKETQNRELVDDLKNENTLQSQRIRLLAEEIKTIKDDIESDIAEDQEEILELRDAIEKKDAAIAAMQENMENQSPDGLLQAQAARDELAHQLDETTQRSNEQKQMLDELEKSLSEEVEKSQFLRNSLANEISKRETQEERIAALEEENNRLEKLYQTEVTARKALHAFNMQKHIGENPLLQGNAPDAILPSSSIDWQEEKIQLKNRIAELSQRHDNLVVENQVLYQRLEEVQEAPTETATNEPHPEFVALQQENTQLKAALEKANKVIAQPSPLQQDFSYLEASNKALQAELHRIKKSNFSLSKELEQLQRNFTSLEQESIALERSSTPVRANTPLNNPQRHVVRKGETLSEISMLYYGTSKKWKNILEANSDKIRSSNMIQVGMELTIPKNLETE